MSDDSFDFYDEDYEYDYNDAMDEYFNYIEEHVILEPWYKTYGEYLDQIWMEDSCQNEIKPDKSIK